MGSTRMYHLRGEISKNVEKGSQLYTDALHSYRGLPVDGFMHDFVDHAVEYVKDSVVHTNGLENFWSLFKRTLKGTYVSVEPFHLQGYADEQAFRFNNRKTDDSDRLKMAVDGVTGKRITYKELTDWQGQQEGMKVAVPPPLSRSKGYGKERLKNSNL
jgi:transposase-like protein